MKTLRHLLLVLTATIASAACAHDVPPPPNREMKGPPPHFDASRCKDKAPGTVVETTTPDGRTIKGTCQLVLLPERPPRDERPQ